MRFEPDNSRLALDAELSRAYVRALFARREDASLAMATKRLTEWSLSKIWRTGRVFLPFILGGAWVLWFLSKDEREFWVDPAIMPSSFEMNLSSIFGISSAPIRTLSAPKQKARRQCRANSLNLNRGDWI